VAANPDWKWALARTYALAGRRNEAEQLLAEYEKEAKADPLGLAAVYTSLGDKEKAFQWLEGAYKARHPFMPWIKFVSYLKPLRADARLQDLARRTGVPQ
jgi:predicted Zn-dependent protease